MAEASRPKLPDRLADGSVVIPTDDGKYVALREPVKTVGKGSQERELRVLTPEEKQKRRFVRNVIVYTIGLVILIVTFALLAR